MADKEELRQRPKSRYCDICNLCCSSVIQLHEHVLGQKHRLKAKDVFSESLLLLHRLQYFIDTYMKHEPLVGLEYVVEVQRKDRYKYRCVLCNFHGDQKPLLVHISGSEHIAKYVEIHHPEKLLDPASYAEKAEYTKAMQLVAADVCQLHGKKTIKEIHPDMYTDPPATTPKSNHSNGEQCPAGFKGNADFLDYLQNVQIQGDSDASIIRQITQNCVQALLRYQKEEQALLGGSPAPDNRTEKGLSVGNCGKVVPRSEEPTDATQLVSSRNYGKVVPRSETPTDATQLVSSRNYGKVVPRSEAPTDATQLVSSGNYGKVVPRLEARTDATRLVSSRNYGKVVPRLEARTDATRLVSSGNYGNVVPRSEVPTGNYGKVVPRSEAPTVNYGKVVPRSEAPTDATQLVISGNYGKVVPRLKEPTDAIEMFFTSGNYGKVVPRSEAPTDAIEMFFNSENCEKVVPTSEGPTDAMQLFFNSIKDMEEADVVKILQKIVVTNPAFRGIDVPTVIKYLQATGRLKPS